MNVTWVYLTSQAPRIGAGWRGVEVLKVGYKWVTVRYWPGGHGSHSINQKFRLPVWEQIKKRVNQ